MSCYRLGYELVLGAPICLESVNDVPDSLGFRAGYDEDGVLGFNHDDVFHAYDGDEAVLGADEGVAGGVQ